ncbi:MAG: SUMF1/EgtB/PvdO family nonheme iron enzyme [Acidobacteria bacterium]|nr:SUMF1/EgtB/PvdO family nonheme iron enzyme [Acidobacteriota bacterium]
MFYEGRQIGGYTLLRKLGKGGFGEVWLAEKRSQFVTKRVAVKLPLDEQVNFDAIRQEAGLWEQASGHPNVLPIIDADIVAGQVLIVSEYADGGSLADKIKREGKLPLQKTVEMTIGILNGLEFLHSRRIIHRDIKPQNILLQGETPRLADFGISRAMSTTVVSSTIIGTDAYMAPESFDGKRTVQTDIWSVGVVLYALLADRLPFPQEHPSERMFAILTKKFEALPPEVPQNLQWIVYKALAKEPENRFRTTTEMRDNLQKALVGIAHPTFARTEVLRVSTENVRLAPTLENRHRTNEPEKETVVNPQKNNLPAPTQPVSAQQSIVTRSPVVQAPAAFQPLPNTARAVAADTSRRKTAYKILFGVIGAGVIAGFLVFAVIAFLVIGSYNRPVTSNANIASNANALTNANTAGNSDNSSIQLPKAGDIQKNSYGMEFVFIPNGDFQMGSEEEAERYGPSHKVSLTRNYWIGKTEVTQAQWFALMGDNPSFFQNCDQCPVDQVTWDDAQKFVAKLNAAGDGYKYRLPTEAEWEYAARAGTTENSVADLDSQGWYEGNAGKKTHPVASKRPNNWGLYDMFGNINEWCEDRYSRYSSLGESDPTRTDSDMGSKRVLRGGGYLSPAIFVNQITRAKAEPSKRAEAVGVRIVRQKL